MSDHRCLAGTACRGAVSVDDTTTGKTSRLAAIIGQEHGLCDACRGAVEHTVNDLTETWLALHVAIGDTARRLGQKVNGSRSAPINLNTDADALKVEIVEWVVAATARVCDTLGIEEEPRPRNNTDTEHANVLIACTRILEPNIDRLIEMPADNVMVWLSGKETRYPGERFYLDEQGVPHVGIGVIAMSGAELAWRLVQIRGKARAHLELAPNDKLPLPCPRCNLYTLTRTRRTTVSGTEIDQVDCGTCGFSRPYTHYQNLCQMWVEEDQVERDKLQKKLDAEKERRETAEFRLAKHDWWFSLAVNGVFGPDVSAAAFAATVLADPDYPEEGVFMSDKDIANLVGVSDSTIRAWAAKGVIERHTADDGSVRFLATEVWDYAKANASPRTSTVRRLETARKINESSTP